MSDIPDKPNHQKMRERPRQMDRLLPLGGYQYLALCACRALAGRASVSAIHGALIQAGLTEAKEQQAAVTMLTLRAKGLVSAMQAPSQVDSTRKANVHIVTPEGHAILEKMERNFARVMAAAEKLLQNKKED